MTVSGQLVAVGGVRIHVDVRPGDPRVTPLLLINGIGAGLEAFGSFIEALDPAITVIRVDPPGLGGSPAMRRPYRMPALARTLLGVLDVLEQSRVDVLGISWGGFLAQQLAYTGGARCRRLILVATGAGGAMVPAPPWVLTKMVTPRRYQDPVYFRRIAPAIYGGSARHDPAVAALALHSPTGTGPGRGYVHQLAAITGWTSVRFLRTLRQPTLILAGDDDPLVPLINARILGALIPNARVHVYSGGHVELVADPHGLVPTIEDFLFSDDAATDVARPGRRARWTGTPEHLE